MRHLPIYLRTHRKTLGLTQREAAFLVGLETGQIISRHEHMVRVPSLKTAIAYQALFAKSLRSLFPAFYQEVEVATLKRVRVLRAELGDGPCSRRLEYKRQQLEDAIRRTGTRLKL